MKKSMLIATCALLLLAAGCNDKNKPETITGNVAAPAWTAPEKYDMTSSMTAIIRVDLAVNYPDQVAKAQWQVAEGDVLAAFSGETCLGVAELVDGLYYLYITAPSEGTNVKLKYYSAALKNIFVSEPITYSNDAHLGSESAPYIPLLTVQAGK